MFPAASQGEICSKALWNIREWYLLNYLEGHNNEKKAVLDFFKAKFAPKMGFVLIQNRIMRNVIQY